ncbi:MAG: PilN domain-containing protein [Thermoanaerobaculia bacterium]
MKVLHPNLAARPYRDYRPVWAVAALLAIATAALLVYNLQTAYRYFATTEETRREIARLEAEIEAERAASQAARQQIAQYDTGLLRARSAYINARIAERAFSWSQLLDDLEAVFPNDVRLTTLSPRPTREGHYVINMQAHAKSEDGMIELLNNLLASAEFDRPFPQSQLITETGTYRFSIAAEYRPQRRGIRE